MRTTAQSRALGRMLTIGGFVLFLGSPVTAWLADSEPDGGWWLVVLTLALFFGGGAMMIRGKQHLTPIRDWTWVVDQPSPIIYLRSFDAERGDYGFKRFFAAAFGVVTGRSMAYGASGWMPTFQAQLAMVMNRVGSYVAVGRPGEQLPGLGAVRCYVDDDWEHRVRDILSASTLAVLRAGTTEGLDLEVSLCREVLRPEQLLMIVPVRKSDHTEIRELLAERHDLELPDRSRALLIRFDDEWKPVPLTPRFGLTRTLRPFFQANGLQPPRADWLDGLRLLLR